MRRGLNIVAGLIVAIIAAAFFMPWKSLVQSQLERYLANSGVRHPAVSVSGLSLSGIELGDISFGEKNHLTLKNVKVDYSLRSLLNKTIQGISLSDLTVEMEKQAGRWVVYGLEDVSPGKAGDAAFSLPVTLQAFSGLPAAITLDKGLLKLHMENLQMEAPANVQWQTSPAHVALQSEGLHVKGAAFQLTANAKLDASLDTGKAQWDGTWQVSDIVLAGAPVAVPPLTAVGTLRATADSATLEGNLQSADKTYALRFALRYDMTHPQTSTLTLRQGQWPWGGGLLAVDSATIPFSGKGFTFPVQIKNIAVDEVLKILTGGKAQATGTISGMLPLIAKADGTVLLGQSRLTAVGAGKIVMQPDAIPGDNEQITLVREIMKDLRYTVLGVEGQNEAGNRLSVTLLLEGSNPAVLNGRPVKLKVHLTGDVLDFLKQNIANFTDPKTLLKTDTHATH